jgi:hypothetical protein
MQHFGLIHSGLDVAPMLAELEAAPWLWNEHRARKDAEGSPHSRMDDIWIRAQDLRPFEAGLRPWSEFNDPHVPVNYPGWFVLPSLRPVVFALMAAVSGEMLCTILITRIQPGAGIDRHVDPG